MPDLPLFSKRAPLKLADSIPQHPCSRLRYAELHCRTNFSFLEGASHPDELVVQAAHLGYQGLAITDRNSLAGVVRAHAAAKECGLKLVIGAEVTPSDAPRVVLWAQDRGGYGHLARLLTVGRRRAAKGECELTFDDIAEHSARLLAGVVVERSASGEMAQQGGDLERYRELFGDGAYLLAELHYGVDDRGWLEELVRVGRKHRLPLVAAGDVHYHVPERMVLQQVVTAIRHRTTVAELGEGCLANAERHLRSLHRLEEIYAAAPTALRHTTEIANRCTFSLDELRYEYPEELVPAGETPASYLARLARQGARRRYGETVPPKVKGLLEHELRLIAAMRYEAFFLTVYDLVQFARSRNILCQGRGSAANSAVCYALGITEVDPQTHELLFERFISQERDEAPDIDVDFEHERREEVLQYLYTKYGRDRAGLAATVITYRPKSAIRDVGKALGFSLERVDTLAKNYDSRGETHLMARRCEQSGIDATSRTGAQLLALVNELVGFPRHLSQHVGGMVITQGPLCELVPIENAAMDGRTVIEWDKDDLEELGILKVDCLALGMLTAIRKCFELVRLSTGRELSIATIPHDDSAVYDMIGRADTVGVFQIESRAQMSMLPRLKPRTFYDLVIEVAIVRPGPIQGNMVHPYLRRRNGEEEVVYPGPEVEGVLQRTLGVPLFQEQAMQLAVVAAGFTPGEADQLRRAMGAWRRQGLIDTYRKKLIDGMLAKGYTPEFAEQLFLQIRGFGEYGFPESHAASFAILVYVSAWLKHYYPAAFAAALVNSQPMGFYAPAQLVRDAREHGIEVRGVDINHSDWDCTLEATTEQGVVALRLGLRLIKGLAEGTARQIVKQRTTPYGSMAELSARTGLKERTIARLAGADAFGSLKLNRRAAVWQALDPPLDHQAMPLLAGLPAHDSAPPPLPELLPRQEVFADYAAASLSLRDHPMTFFRQELAARGVVPCRELLTMPHNSPVKVAGLVLMRQRPGTAKGVTFVTLEDETGIANLIVQARTWERYDLVARRSKALIVSGRLERQGIVVHVVAQRMEDLEDRVAELPSASRDFR